MRNEPKTKTTHKTTPKQYAHAIICDESRIHSVRCTLTLTHEREIHENALSFTHAHVHIFAIFGVPMCVCVYAPYV